MPSASTLPPAGSWSPTNSQARCLLSGPARAASPSWRTCEPLLFLLHFQISFQVSFQTSPISISPIPSQMFSLLPDFRSSAVAWPLAFQGRFWQSSAHAQGLGPRWLAVHALRPAYSRPREETPHTLHNHTRLQHCTALRCAVLCWLPCVRAFVWVRAHDGDIGSAPLGTRCDFHDT